MHPSTAKAHFIFFYLLIRHMYVYISYYYLSIYLSVYGQKRRLISLPAFSAHFSVSMLESSSFRTLILLTSTSCVFIVWRGVQNPAYISISIKKIMVQTSAGIRETIFFIEKDAGIWLLAVGQTIQLFK